MTYCIECGAKAPDVAKFCPQCGSALVAVDAVSDPTPAPITADVGAADIIEVEAKTVIADVPEATDDIIDEEISTETETASAAEPFIVDTVPSVAASLATAASLAEDEPKSKAGLFIGLGLVGLMAAGGGAYAMGLFGGSDEDGKRAAIAPNVTTPAALPDTKTIEINTRNSDPLLSAYKDAIKTGRISDLGKFAKEHPESSLAKDAQDAAFTSLKRQGSVSAFTAFIGYFPEADTSSYTGPRVNTEEDMRSTEVVTVESDEANTSPNEPTSSIRTSITQRATDLDSFLAQGDTEYALSVIDEMLALTDLNESEATYLLNLRARAETSHGLITAAQPDLAQTAPVEPILIQPASVDITPVAEPAPEVPAIAAAKPTAPIPAYDTPAKPVDRFGAITPDEATEPGECDMTFSVNLSGSPTNIIADCTDPLFIAPAKEAVSEWSYSPALLAGSPVQQDDLVVKIKFHLE